MLESKRLNHSVVTNGKQADISTTQREKKNENFQAGNVLVLSFAHFIHDIYSSFLAPLLPSLIEKLSMNLTQAGFLGTIMQLPVLFNPLIGKIADRTSARYFIILTPMMTAVPMSLMGLAPSYTVLLFLLFTAGVSNAVFHVPTPVMISHFSGKKSSGKGMSFYMTGGELARTVSPIIAVTIVSLLSLEGFYPTMVIGIACSAWLLFRYHDVPIKKKAVQNKSLMETWREMQFFLLPLTAILFARGFMYAAMTVFLPTYIKFETGNLWYAGISLTVLEGAGVVSTFFSGTLSDKFGRREILFVSLISSPICILLFVLTNGWLQILMLIFTGLTLLSTTPVMLAIVQEYGVNSPAAANGFYMMMSFIARSAITVLIGIFADFVGLRTTYVISAVIGTIGIIFVFILPKKGRETDA